MSNKCFNTLRISGSSDDLQNFRLDTEEYNNLKIKQYNNEILYTFHTENKPPFHLIKYIIFRNKQLNCELEYYSIEYNYWGIIRYYDENINTENLSFDEYLISQLPQSYAKDLTEYFIELYGLKKDKLPLLHDENSDFRLYVFDYLAEFIDDGLGFYCYDFVMSEVINHYIKKQNNIYE